LVNTENSYTVNIDLESGKYIPRPEFHPKLTFGAAPTPNSNTSPVPTPNSNTSPSKQPAPAHRAETA